MKKGKKKKVLIITLSIVGAIIVLPLGFLGVVTLSSNNRSLSVDRTVKIENNTGLVQQKGKALYDKDGNFLLLRGTNAGNLLVSEGWLSPFSVGENLNENQEIELDHDGLPTYPVLPMEDAVKGFESNPNLTDSQRKELVSIYRDNWFSKNDFTFIKNMGLNMVRLPFYWRDILDETNEGYVRKSEDEAFAYIDSFVKNCQDAGLYCILDLHGAVGGQNGYEHSGTMEMADLWKEEKYQNATADLWAYVAKHYSTTRKDLAPTIAAYDLMNEPCADYSNPNSGTIIKTCYPVFDKIYDAIRNEGDNHVICIEGVWSFDMFDDPKNWGWENILYQTHLYNWSNEKVPYWLFNDYHELHNWGHDYDVPYYIGEFTFFEDPSAWQSQLEMFEKRGYSWSFWSYKAAVTGWWTTSWSIYTQQLDLRNGKTKLNLKTATYDECKVAFEATNSSKCVLSRTYGYVTDFIKSQK